MGNSRQENADHVIEDQLTKIIIDLENLFKADVLSFVAPIYYGVDDHIRNAIETLYGNAKRKKPKLVVLIETSGGYIEVAERIVNTFRTHYRRVEFVIPNNAMSAGTVIVLSGDAIHMDYYSVLGPIDPQVRDLHGRTVPALGYLEEYNRLINKSKNKNLTTAELHFLIERFDPAALFSFKQARDLSVSLLEDWLVRYKFRNWKVTATNGTKVTQKMRRDRATKIAEQLNDAKDWCSHGRGISIEVLRRKLKLIIDDFGQNSALNEKILAYNRLLTNYRRKIGVEAIVHIKNRFNSIG